ncbi:MAG: zinc ribbon domain-containing protein [Armatimonadetes bacterium]|nr:zinc ribbon domain-containing protein [Armatimonadota bacterium]
MPIYEYEPVDHDCKQCHGRFEMLQRVDEEALTVCPTCGKACRRVVSRPSFKMDTNTSPDKAAEKGFTTYKRSGKGNYERVAGSGGPETLSADDV